MPRYKCKVDRVISFEFELTANSKEEVEDKIITLDLDESKAINIVRETESIEELPEIAALFTYPVLPENAPQDLKDAYTVFEKYLKASIELPGIIENDNLLAEHIKADKEKIRKQSDTTKITQKQYDLIVYTFKEYSNGQILGCNSSEKLVKLLNTTLNLNKSRSVYSKIWCGGVDRESLPKGE